MKLKIVSVILLALILLTTVLARCDLIVCVNPKQFFKLLAVEAYFTDTIMAGGQILIHHLLKYNNWNKETDEYESHIKLLSRFDQDEVIEEARPYWEDYSTKEKIRESVEDFSGESKEGEVVVFFAGMETEVTIKYTQEQLLLCQLLPQN